MVNEKKSKSEYCSEKKHWGSRSMGGGIYGLALIGALVYFLQHAETFWLGVLGILKAIVWPAILSYKLLEFFGL